jgi:hypothetical protein
LAGVLDSLLVTTWSWTGSFVGGRRLLFAIMQITGIPGRVGLGYLADRLGSVEAC